MVTPPVHVNFQVSPIVNIEDVVKYRRNLRQDVDPQTWKRRMGRKRPSTPLVGSRDGMNNLISSESNCTTSSSVKCATETPIGDIVPPRGSRNGLNMKPILQVTVAIDNETPSMIDTFKTEELEDEDNYENPLQMFEEISRELKENLLLEKQIAMNKQGHTRNGSRGRDRNVCSWNASLDVKVEGSAKDFRLARREKFREEQRILEDEREAIARKEREDRREKMKKAKKESDKKSKEKRELDEKKRKLEYEAEERKRRESIEAEFKKKREEERLKRQEKKREESTHVSFKKSEL